MNMRRFRHQDVGGVFFKEAGEDGLRVHLARRAIPARPFFGRPQLERDAVAVGARRSGCRRSGRLLLCGCQSIRVVIVPLS
jgi:hypothetical protein